MWGQHELTRPAVGGNLDARNGVAGLCAYSDVPRAQDDILALPTSSLCCSARALSLDTPRPVVPGHSTRASISLIRPSGARKSDEEPSHSMTSRKPGREKQSDAPLVAPVMSTFWPSREKSSRTGTAGVGSEHGASGLSEAMSCVQTSTTSVVLETSSKW